MLRFTTLHGTLTGDFNPMSSRPCRAYTTNINNGETALIKYRLIWQRLPGPSQTFLILVSFFVFFSGITPAQNTEKYALLIGIADYSAVPGLYSLDGTLNDIDLTRDVLLQKHLGFQKDNITILKDSQATHKGIEKAMSDLAAKVKKKNGGLVYIHYSGHGSQTRNFHSAEREKFDQTWVSYGARTTQFDGLDQWDILDDEIHEWLTLISEYADQVILVSDSCHSGSITRGQFPLKTRAATPDKRKHPLTTKLFRSDILPNSAFISASDDTEQAGEYVPDDIPYGLFTWFWTESLGSARSGDTWHDLLWKTRIQVQGERSIQTPQISGTLSDTSVFGGSVTERKAHFPVLSINNIQQTASILHGTITGASVGSTYQLFDPTGSRQERTLLELISCTPFKCEGKVSGGSLKVTDFMIEKQHAYTIKPITLSIDGDFASLEDMVIIKELRSSFAVDPIPGYTLVDAKSPHTMAVYVTRQDLQPEIWILNSTHQLWHADLKIKYHDQAESWQQIRNTLTKIARAKEIKRLSSQHPPSLTVIVNTWAPIPSCTIGDDCLKDRQGYFEKESTFPFTKLEDQNLQEDDSVTFTIKNNGENDIYLYILNIGPDDAIVVLFPRRGTSNDEAAKLRHGRQDIIDTRETGRLVLSSGNETIKIIASEEPIPVKYFAQESYIKTEELKDSAASTRGFLNPFNSLIVAAIGGKTRGKLIMADPTLNKWGTMQMSVNILLKKK